MLITNLALQPLFGPQANLMPIAYCYQAYTVVRDIAALELRQTAAGLLYLLLRSEQLAIKKLFSC